MITLELKIDAITNEKYWKAAGKPEDFRCSVCSKEISEGFICENNKKIVICQECHKNFKMSKCKHDKFGEHKHLKFTKNVNL